MSSHKSKNDDTAERQVLRAVWDDCVELEGHNPEGEVYFIIYRDTQRGVFRVRGIYGKNRLAGQHGAQQSIEVGYPNGVPQSLVGQLLALVSRLDQSMPDEFPF